PQRQRPFQVLSFQERWMGISAPTGSRTDRSYGTLIRQQRLTERSTVHRRRAVPWTAAGRRSPPEGCTLIRAMAGSSANPAICYWLSQWMANEPTKLQPPPRRRPSYEAQTDLWSFCRLRTVDDPGVVSHWRGRGETSLGHVHQRRSADH